MLIKTESKGTSETLKGDLLKQLAGVMVIAIADTPWKEELPSCGHMMQQVQ